MASKPRSGAVIASGKQALAWLGMLVTLTLIFSWQSGSKTLLPEKKGLPPVAGMLEPEKKDLEHFDGVIGRSESTYDMVRSNLAVRACQALEKNDAKTAETLYREMVAKYPTDPDSYSSLGACLYFQEKFEDANAQYLKALELNENSVRGLYGIGCVEYKQKRYAEARDHLEKALTLNEMHSLGQRMLGLVYDKLGEKSKAILHYERAIELSPTIAAEEYIQKRLKALKEKVDCQEVS